jgi:large subunit ribosomal protein L10
MPRPEKVQAVAEIRERLENSRAVFLTEFRGLSVKDVQDLRRSLRRAGADYKVVKMTLAKLAAGAAGIEGLDEFLAGPTALAFADEDAVATAKALKEFSKANEAFVLKAAYLAGEILTPEEVSKLADVEPREVLLAKIAGAARAPLYKAAGMFGSFTRDAASVFAQLLEMKESGETEPVKDAPEASLPAEEPAETTADAAEEE